MRAAAPPARARTRPGASAGSRAPCEPEPRRPERDRARRDDAHRRAGADDLARSPPRARAAASGADGPRASTTRLEPSLTTSGLLHRLLRPVADDAVLAQPEIAIRDGPARSRHAVDVDPRLGRAGQREPVGEARRRVPERRGAAVGVEEALGRRLVLGDDRSGEAGRLVDSRARPPRRASRRRARSPTRCARDRSPTRGRSRSGSRTAMPEPLEQHRARGPLTPPPPGRRAAG